MLPVIMALAGFKFLTRGPAGTPPQSGGGAGTPPAIVGTHVETTSEGEEVTITNGSHLVDLEGGAYAIVPDGDFNGLFVPPGPVGGSGDNTGNGGNSEGEAGDDGMGGSAGPRFYTLAESRAYRKANRKIRGWENGSGSKPARNAPGRFRRA